MGDGQRSYDGDGRRRWVTGGGGEIPQGARKLLEHGLGAKWRRWESAGRAAGSGVDQVDAESILWALVDAGLVKVRQRRTRRGEWEAYRWALTEAGRDYAGAEEELKIDIDTYLDGDDGEHLVLQRIRRWLTTVGRTDDADPTLVGLLIAIGRSFRRGRIPRGRLLSIDVGGHTKAVRVDEWRDEIGEALGLPFDDVVVLHGQSVLAYGAFEFQIREHRIAGDWSVPWMAITSETLEAMEGLEATARRVVTIENLVAFEEYVRREMPDHEIAVFTRGMPSRLVIRFLEKIIRAGTPRVAHWGDLDLGGLRIFRHLREVLPVAVEPFRMEPALLGQLPGCPLTDDDIDGLRSWLDDDAPLPKLAAQLLEHGEKVEQESWFLWHD